MARRLIAVSLTLRPDQIEVMSEAVGPSRDRSQWVRQAIDLRIAYEKSKTLDLTEQFMEDLDKNATKAIQSGNNANSHAGDSNDVRVKAPHDARAPLARKRA